MNPFYQAVAERVLTQVSLEPLKNRSVLITGANGLIGSHMMGAIALANRQFDLNVKVTLMSRSASPAWVAEMITDAGFEFVQRDLSLGLSEGWNREFDEVIHSATYSAPKQFLSDPIATMRLNGEVTAELLELAAKRKGGLLFMSSTEIYGNPPPDAHPIREDYPGNVSPLDHRAPYTSSKRYGETLCKVYNDQGKVRARIARVGSTYGPGVSLADDRVMYTFIRRALQSSKITMMDRGLQKRRWLYISDAVAMLFHILLHSKDIAYNVSGTDLRTVFEMAEYVAAESGATLVLPEITEDALPLAGALSLIDLDNSKILKETGMKTLLSLREGVRPCVSWARELSAISS